MELVPILSTIILVGTIATFILAVAAYILYKIRERRSRGEYAPEERRREDPHVLVEPARRSALGPRREAPAGAFYGREQRPGRVPDYAGRFAGQERAYSLREERPLESRSEFDRPETGRGAERNESLFWEYTEEGFVPVRTTRDPGFGSETPQDEFDQGEPRRLDSDRAAWT